MARGTRTTYPSGRNSDVYYLKKSIQRPKCCDSDNKGENNSPNNVINVNSVLYDLKLFPKYGIRSIRNVLSNMLQNNCFMKKRLNLRIYLI